MMKTMITITRRTRMEEKINDCVCDDDYDNAVDYDNKNINSHTTTNMLTLLA